jgi:hypothetical protein
VLRTLLEAPKLAPGVVAIHTGWLDKVLKTPILQLPS